MKSYKRDSSPSALHEDRILAIVCRSTGGRASAPDQYAIRALIQSCRLFHGFQQSIDRNRDGSNLNGAEETGGKLRRIQQQQEHTLLDAYA